MTLSLDGPRISANGQCFVLGGAQWPPEAATPQLACRQLGARDSALVLRHFKGLCQADLRFRFGTSVSPLWLERYVDDFWARPGLALGMQHKNAFFALGELRPSQAAPADVCEIGLSVHVALRQRGHGTYMLSTLLSTARSAGFERAELLVLAENTAMRRICSKLNGDAQRFEDQYLYDVSTRHLPRGRRPLTGGSMS